VENGGWHWPADQTPGGGSHDSIRYESVRVLLDAGIISLSELHLLMPKQYEDLARVLDRAKERHHNLYLDSTSFRTWAIVDQLMADRDAADNVRPEPRVDS
jgi:hypothetical protein